MLKTEIAAASDLEAALRNGVLVARLAVFFAPATVKEKNIYDLDLAVYKEQGLKFRHTDNIARWINAMITIKFPYSNLLLLNSIALCNNLFISYFVR